MASTTAPGAAGHAGARPPGSYRETGLVGQAHDCRDFRRIGGKEHCLREKLAGRTVIGIAGQFFRGGEQVFRPDDGGEFFKNGLFQRAAPKKKGAKINRRVV